MVDRCMRRDSSRCDPSRITLDLRSLVIQPYGFLLVSYTNVRHCFTFPGWQGSGTHPLARCFSFPCYDITLFSPSCIFIRATKDIPHEIIVSLCRACYYIIRSLTMHHHYHNKSICHCKAQCSYISCHELVFVIK